MSRWLRGVLPPWGWVVPLAALYLACEAFVTFWEWQLGGPLVELAVRPSLVPLVAGALLTGGLRVRTFKHIHDLSIADQNEQRRGAFVARVTADVDILGQFMEWGAVSWFTSPARRASYEPIGVPVRFISSALPSPTRRGSRWVPPKPGMIPRLISGWPKVADSAAIRTSQAIASSQPPPNASALTAAIVTVPVEPNERSTAWPVSSSSRPPASSIWVKALMSAPAQKSIGLDEATTSAWMDSSPSTRSQIFCSARITSGEMELAGGLSSHAIAIPSRVSSLTGPSSQPASGRA